MGKKEVCVGGNTYFCLFVLGALWVQVSLLTHLSCSCALDKVSLCFLSKDQAKPRTLCFKYTHTMVFILSQATVDSCKICVLIIQVHDAAWFQPELLTWTSTYPASAAVTEESQMTQSICRKSTQGKTSACDLCLVECKMKNVFFVLLPWGLLSHC